MYRRIGGRALIFAGWLVSATLYAGTLVDTTESSSGAWFAHDPSSLNFAAVAFIGISLVGLGWSRSTKA
jgi:hypothetical protein